MHTYISIETDHVNPNHRKSREYASPIKYQSMAAPAELLILSENDVRIALSRIETLEASRDAFLAVTPPTSDSANTNAAVVPTRTIIDVPRVGANDVSRTTPRDTLFKPAALASKTRSHVSSSTQEEERVTMSVGLKVVSVRPENAAKGMPTVPGYIFLVDAESGLARALIAATVRHDTSHESARVVH